MNTMQDFAWSGVTPSDASIERITHGGLLLEEQPLAIRWRRVGKKTISLSKTASSLLCV